MAATKLTKKSEIVAMPSSTRKPKQPMTPISLLAAAQLPRLSPYKVASDPTTLVQSARRRLQYSQLPIRCSAGKRQGRLVSSLKKFPVLSPKRCISAKSAVIDDEAARFLACASGAGSSRKSLSLTDLTQATGAAGDFEPADLRSSDSGTSSARLEDVNDRRTDEALSVDGRDGAASCLTVTSSIEEEREARAASLVCRVLAVNAWRRRRVELMELRSGLAGLTQQLDQVQLQIHVLRRLLDNENARVASLAAELNKAKAQVEEVTRERDAFKSEKEAAEAEAQQQREIGAERAVVVENLRNELRTARDQLNALEKQISRDREKLLKLREDKKILLEKVSAIESLASERASRADKAELSLEDMQIQLATQIALTSSLQEEVQRFLNKLREKEDEKAELERTLQKMEDENQELKKRLEISEEAKNALSLRAEELESKLSVQKAKLIRLETECNIQTLELTELREKLLRQSEESCWSSKVLQFAGSFARAPRILLRTLSFISEGIPLIF